MKNIFQPQFANSHCKHHKVIPDPDPNDWFCDDNVAVVCLLVKNDKQDVKSKYLSDTNEFKTITVSCRPYNIEKETEVPEWCPKNQ